MKTGCEHIYIDCGDWAEEAESRACIFSYPRIGDAEWESFYDAQELWHAGYDEEAEAGFRQLVAEFPEFIDAWHHLAMLLDETGRAEEAFQIWERTVKMGLDLIPESFRRGTDLLMWGHTNNRPFLRAYHGYALALQDRGRLEEALGIFEHLLELNPNDNQGVRALASDAYFAFDRPEAVLELCERYPDDAMEHIVYGRPLALLKLGRAEEAEQALDEAIDFYPLIAEELLKTRHPKPAQLRLGKVTLGGRDQAYYYYKDQGTYWKHTPIAMDLLARCVEKAGGADGAPQA
jgi:tetratricopeptide (TPR) repeat protein